MIADSSTPELAEAWTSEIHRFVLRVFRARLLLVVLFVAVLLVFMAYEPVAWRLVWLGVTAALTAILSLHEYFRMRRMQPGIITIQLNLAAVLALQTSMIVVTGGIESPMLPVYVPFGLVAGLSLRSAGRVLPVVAIPVVAVLVLAAGGHGSWFPRTTPAFFGLGQGFSDQPVYVWTTAAVLVVLIVTTAGVGAMMRTSYERITRQVGLQRKDMLDGLASRNRELLSVASTVAHELKNPLASIQGLAQLMARTAAQGKEQERLEVMRKEIARMATVLDEFRNFSRPLSGLSLTRTRLRRLIEDMVLLNEGRAEARGVRLQLADGDEVELVCDPQKIKQAVLNLVQNALDATPSGGRVELDVRMRDERNVRVTVTDTGTGIAPELSNRLFTPGATSKQHGSGIGLVVARSIAEQHGGTVELRDGSRGGCVACLQLPVRAAVPMEMEA
jgi:signal transduction histidine kinase